MNRDSAKLTELYYAPRGFDNVGDARASMHAKCVVVDNRAVFISSANFTAAAHQRNIELGVRLALPAAALRLTEFPDRLIESSVVIRV